MLISKDLRIHYNKVGRRYVPKIGYDTEEAARAQETRTNRGVYLCDVCNKYHTGRKKRIR